MKQYPLTILIWLLLLCGCTQIILPGAKYNSLMTEKQVDSVEYISEPNSLTIRVKFIKSTPQDLTVVTPYGVLETEGKSE